MTCLSAIQMAEDWRALLPERLAAIGRRLRAIGAPGELGDSALESALEAVREGLQLLARRALEHDRNEDALAWLDWACRLFLGCRAALSACLAVRPVRSLFALGELGEAAAAIAELAREARDLVGLLASSEIRGAA